jgi:hypothetical protein
MGRDRRQAVALDDWRAADVKSLTAVPECPLLVVLTYRADPACEVIYKPTPYRPVFSRIFLRACKTVSLLSHQIMVHVGNAD